MLEPNTEMGRVYQLKINKLKKEHPGMFDSTRYRKFHHAKTEEYRREHWIDGTSEAMFKIWYWNMKEWVKLETRPIEKRVTRSTSKVK